ncbi:o-succinylbenzoate synthase [Streptomyces sp. NPDC087512]|uniref:o-succinylbenzoate synthase n=1 Tax=Streptomyces sp. NPDC087512 TaxID=3155059 RepID=UPI003445A154
MKLQQVELREVALPLVSPFRTSLGTQVHRNSLLVKVTTVDGVVGWGECVTDDDPTYSAEYLAGARDVLRWFLLPRLFPIPELTAALVPELLRPIRGNPMAKAAVEMAVLDAELQTAGISLAQYFGATRSELAVGVSVGIMDTVDELLGAVDGYLSAGYARVKLKIEPGWDVEPLRAVRETFGPEIPLQVDANTAYSPGDLPHLRQFDDYGLTLIEQPFAPDDLLSHTRLAARMDTPICLDESITSARDAATAIRQEACSIVNIKPGRVGGYLEARRIHDLCLANGVPVWCGGMLETGLGRAANLALAALPGFTMPGDISATARYYTRDITAPFVLRDGHLTLPTGPGIGIVPDPEALQAATTSTELLSA